MIIDARSLPENTEISTDVCIVGAGTAGLTLAREFAGQKFRVCLLESGGLKPDPETQALYKGENIGHPYFSLDSARARYFGGSTNRWHIPIGEDCIGVRMRPLDEIDFEERDWVPNSGWPFKKSHLDPYYERAQAVCRIEPSSYDVSDWENPEKTPRLTLDRKRIHTVIFKFGSRLPFLVDYSKEITQAGNIATYLYANVTEVATDEGGRKATRLKAACLNGKKFSIRAKIFILAAGAIEIPRLLLLSNKTHHAGLGNQHDLVGRFFMEHPHFWSGVYIPSVSEALKITALYNRIHTVNGVPIIGKLSLSEETIRREGLLNYVAELVPRTVLKTSLNQFFYPRIDSESVHSYQTIRSAIRNKKMPEDFKRHAGNIFTGLNDFVVSAYRNIKRRTLRILDKKRILVFRLANMSEQMPNPDSRVTLDTECDALNQRRVRFDWRLSETDIQSAVKSQQILDRELRRAGLGRLYVELNDKTPPRQITGGWHHMGTTRMHVDPQKGVVNENCRVHGIPNLFIAGPSVFPTSGYANPSLTIVALSLRLADHVKKLMA